MLNLKNKQQNGELLAFIALQRYIKKLEIFINNFNDKDAELQIKDSEQKLQNETLFNENVFRTLVEGEARNDRQIVNYMEFLFDKSYKDILQIYWDIYEARKSELKTLDNISERIEMQK